MDSPNKHRAFEEGRAAYHDGKTAEDNPYPPNFDEHRFWVNGFEPKVEAPVVEVKLTADNDPAIKAFEELKARLTPEERAAVESDQ